MTAAGLRGVKEVFCVVDGYDLLAHRPKSLSRKVVAVTSKIDGLGGEWEEHTHTGKKRGEFVIAGGYFDTDDGGSHEAFKDSVVDAGARSVARVSSFGFDGLDIGDEFDAFQGLLQTDYEVLSENEDIQKANVTFQVTGQHDGGLILQPLTTKAATWNTLSSSVDNSASSSAGGVGYLQVVEASNLTGYTIKIRHSTNDTTFTDLLAFASGVQGDRKAIRSIVTGTVNRYLAVTGTITGTTTNTKLTIFVGFARM